MIDYAQPPIMTPPPAVIRYAEKHQVKLLYDECQIKPDDDNTFNYKKYKGAFPCFNNSEFCTILYKNRWQVRFATPDELNELYWNFR